MKKKLLIISSDFPYIKNNIRAGNVVLYEIIRCFSNKAEFDVYFCCISFDKTELSSSAKMGLDSLIKENVKILPNIVLNNIPKVKCGKVKSFFLKKVRASFYYLKNMVFSNPEDFINGAANHNQILNELFKNEKFDLALTIWSEIGTAALYKVNIPKIAYYGNPDYKPMITKLKFEMFSTSSFIKKMLKFIKSKLQIILIKKCHLKIMKTYNVVYDVAMNDAVEYKNNGIINAVYLQNIWPYKEIDWEKLRDDNEQLNPLKILGNVGVLTGTANSYGMYILAKEILPLLEKRLSKESFEINLYGRGELSDFLVSHFDRYTSLKIRGFVDDLDKEIISSPIFLVPNNNKYYNVGHTRFLHAWALGSCVVAFQACREAMPEIEHNKNALLANSYEEFVDLIVLASKDKKLRRKIGYGGIETLITKFDPQKVVNIISDDMFKLINNNTY